MAITGILSQGASHVGDKYFVTSFTVKYSKDGHNYKTLEDDGVTKVEFPISSSRYSGIGRLPQLVGLLLVLYRFSQEIRITMELCGTCFPNQY